MKFESEKHRDDGSLDKVRESRLPCECQYIQAREFALVCFVDTSGEPRFC